MEKNYVVFQRQFKILSPNQHIIITIISKFDPKILIDVATYFWFITKLVKKLSILIKLEHTLFTNIDISHIVRSNSSQILRFKQHFTCSNSYSPQNWIEPYNYHDIRKYEVMLPIVMQKTCFIYSFFGRKEARNCVHRINHPHII